MREGVHHFDRAGVQVGRLAQDGDARVIRVDEPRGGREAVAHRVQRPAPHALVLLALQAVHQLQLVRLAGLHVADGVHLEHTRWAHCPQLSSTVVHCPDRVSPTGRMQAPRRATWVPAGLGS